MVLEFVVFSSTARTQRPSDVNLKDLPGSSGRFDVTCRAVAACLSPLRGPPVTRVDVFLPGEVHFRVAPGDIEPGSCPQTELGVARLLLAVLTDPATMPVWLARDSLAIETHLEARRSAGFQLLALDEEGEDLLDLVNSARPAPLDPARLVFVVGDQVGFPHALLEYLQAQGMLASVGPESLLGDQAIKLVRVLVAP